MDWEKGNQYKIITFKGLVVWFFFKVKRKKKSGRGKTCENEFIFVKAGQIIRALARTEGDAIWNYMQVRYKINLLYT